MKKWAITYFIQWYDNFNKFMSRIFKKLFMNIVQNGVFDKHFSQGKYEEHTVTAAVKIIEL